MPKAMVRLAAAPRKTPRGMSRRWRIETTDQPTKTAASTGPNRCQCTESWRFPVRAELMARVRKQVGQGIPVRARSGQLNPGS